jgi:glutamyl-tRNA reductase
VVSGQLRTRPLIEALGIWADGIRARELERAERRLRGLTETERELVDAVTRSLVDALVRDFAERLNETAGAEPARCARTIARPLAPDDEGCAERRDNAQR